MKKKVFSLMMMLVIAAMGFAQAPVLEVIGAGGNATNSNLPTTSVDKYELSQQIYTVEELGVADTITSIAFYNGGSEKTRKIDVYMVLTDKVKFDSITDWIVPTAANKVYSDTALVFKANQWTTLTLSTPFYYNGTQNVAIIVDDNTGSYSSGLACRTFATEEYQSLYVRGDNTNWNPLNPTSGTPAAPYTGTRLYVKNQVRLGGLHGPVLTADLPTNSYYKYNVTQQIIPADELGTTLMFGSMKLFNTGTALTRDLDIYLTHSTKESFADGNDWEVVDTLDLVFSGEVNFAAYDWTTIVFDTMFNYDGVSNLILTVDDNTDIAIAGLNFRTVTDTANMALAYHSDDTSRFNPDPVDLTGITGTLFGVRNVMELMEYEWILHDGTATNAYIPMYGGYFDDYTKSEFVYPASELTLMNGSQITGVTFYPQSVSTGTWNNTHQKVFIKEVDNATLTAYSGMDGATIVFDGQLTMPVAGEPYVITFSTPYYYQGGNLLMGVYNTDDGSYNYVYWYGEAVTGASAAGSNASNLNNVTFTQRNFLPKTKFIFNPAGPVVYDPNLYMFDMRDTTFVDTLFFGDRPNNAWMRPVDMYSLWNYTGGAINMVRFDFTPEDGFFAAEAVGFETPFVMNADDTIPMLFTTNITDTTYADTTFMRQFVAVYDGRTAGVWPIMVHAYNPVCPDVFELAQFLDTIPALAVDSVKTYGPFTFNNPDTIYDNYELPYSDAPYFLADGKDVVYKFVVEEGNEVVLNASVTGANGKAVVYTEDFYGEPGPMVDNFYAGPLLTGSSNRMAPVVDETADNCGEYFEVEEGLRAPWDLMKKVTCTSGYQYGVATDGNFIYTAAWSTAASNMFFKYDMNGNFVEAFDIAALGTARLRDMTYDGQYFYGGANNNKLYCLDLANKQLVSTTTTSVSVIRHCSYDVDNDGFWVGNWHNLYRIDRNGQVVFTPSGLPSSLSIGGTGYFVAEDGSKHLYLNCQPSSNCVVRDYNITTNTYTSTPMFSVSDNLPGATGSAGGAFIGEYMGKVAYFADLQQSPQIVGIYELKDVPAAASTGTYWTPNPVIEGLTLAAGTYYLVGSATSADFTVNIEFAGIPCPEPAVAVAPADDDDAIQPNAVTLQWELGNYTTQYRLKFGTTYYCEDVLVDWTSDLAQSFTVYNLYNNTNYFWRVDEMNGNCEVEGDVWGFTTTFNIPQDLHAQDTSVFVGEDVVMEWTSIQDRTFRQYNVYLNDSLIGHTTETPNPHTYYTYTIPASLLTYNMTTGHRVNVTALYDEGESPYSDPYILKVSGNGTMTGHVYEQDGTTGIAGATVTFTGVNEFGEPETYTATTNASGVYTVVTHVNGANSYMASAQCNGYNNDMPVAPIQPNPRTVAYQATTTTNFIMDESFLAVGNVWAEYYPDITSDDEYVKVYWTPAGSAATGGELTVCDGTTTSSYVPLYGLWVDDYTRTESIYPADILAPLAGTQISSLKYYLSSPATGNFGSASFNVYLMEVPSTTISSYYGSANATVVYSGSLDATQSEMLINFTTPYTYNGGNLLVGIEEPVTGTYHSAYFYGIQSSGSSASGYNSGSLANVSFYQRNFLPKTTFNAGRGGEMAKAGGDRAFHHYRIYRTSCYNDGPYNSDNTVMLASDWPTDTVYIDTNFDTVSPGVYKWGVSCVYQGNRTDVYPDPNGRESQITWSNCLDKDMYLTDVDVTVLLNSADSPEGTRVSFTNLNPTEQELYPMAPIYLDETGFYPFESFRRGSYEITVSKAGYETITETRDIWSDEHLRYVMIEILYPISNLYVSRTGWAMWEPGTQGGGGGGGGDLIDFETGDFSQYTFDNTVSAYPWMVTTENPYQGVYCMKSTNGGNASTTSAIEATVIYGADGTVSFYANCMGEGTSSYNWDKCIFKIDGNTMLETGAQISGWNEYSYPVTAGTHVFRWEYTKDSSVNPTGDAMFVDNISFGGGRLVESGDRHIEGYKVLCTAIDGEPIYNHNTISLEPFCQLATETTIGEPLVEGAHYICKVAAVYSTGTSAWTEVEWQYEPCDHWGPVDDPLTINTEIEGNHVEWTFDHGFNPYDPTNGGAKGGIDDGIYGGSELESGMLATGIYAFNMADIANFDERVLFVANLINDERFDVVLDKNNGVFLINTGKYHENEDLEANVNAFRAEIATEFAQMAKDDAAGLAMVLKNQLPSEYVTAMMMDIYARSRENNLCALADPFCTDNGMYEFPAGVNAGSGESGPDYDCLYTTPNPAWYFMRIAEPGSMDIYMYSTPSVDIDFCCWGPFDDPTAPCPNGLTGDKVVSCSYSAQPTEHCMIPASAQTGEYYILVITNYSNQPCNINFSKVGGNGSTDCGILPPVDIIGFLITMDGEYLDIVGPTVRDYMHEGEYGDHEYCVRPIYPGEMTLPSNNFGWSMGCPICGFSNGEMTCEPGLPIHGDYYYESGDDFGAVINWENFPSAPPAPTTGDEFEENFDAGLPAGWTAIDANNDGYNWVAGSQVGGVYLVSGASLAGSGHNSSADMMCSGSYSNATGAAITPDNYLVTPQVTLVNGSTFSFWACAQDAGYAAEHFGVFVSDNGTSDWTMVNEWTMTAKEGAKAGRGMNAQGNWYEKTVDLSAFAGQKYIAIRHFNCNDQFILNVDDASLTVGAKSDRAELIAYNIYRSTNNLSYDLIATVPADDAIEVYEYYDQIAAGTYYYQVTAVYSNGCESDPALDADNLTNNYVLVQVTGIEDIDGKVAMYPNPTSGLVKIEANSMRHITVVSVLGQVVYDTELTADEYELNMAQFSAGVYMVRIATANGVSTQRLTVVR